MNDIRGALLNITKNVTKTSSSLIKTTKVSMALANEEEVLKSLYIDIGKKVHEIYMYGGSLGKFFDEKYIEIANCESKITAWREQLNSIKGTRECVKCGKVIEKQAGFCPKCGVKLDASAPDIPILQEVAAAPEIKAAMDVSSAPEVPVSADISPGAEIPALTTVLDTPETPVSPAVPAIPVASDASSPSAPMPEPPPATVVICRVCGEENEANVKFCLSCGRIL